MGAPGADAPVVATVVVTGMPLQPAGSAAPSGVPIGMSIHDLNPTPGARDLAASVADGYTAVTVAIMPG